ncbi:MAG: hypothetical protein OXG15_02765 [Gammaproteobacteria bacterium]|nr:hypothetical protein [Gammaproteobacteria bacterium]
MTMNATFLQSLVQNPPKPKFVVIYAIVAPLATLFALTTLLKDEPEWFYILIFTALAIFFWYVLIRNRPMKPKNGSHKTNANAPTTSKYPKSRWHFQIFLGLATTLCALLGFFEEWRMAAAWALVAAPTWFGVYAYWWDSRLVIRHSGK